MRKSVTQRLYSLAAEAKTGVGSQVDSRSVAVDSIRKAIGQSSRETATRAALHSTPSPSIDVLALAERLASSAAASTSAAATHVGQAAAARGFRSGAGKVQALYGAAASKGTSGASSLLPNSVQHLYLPGKMHHRQYWSNLQQAIPKKLPKKLEWASQAVKPQVQELILSTYNARVAIINALYAMQPSTHWARLISLLLAEAVTRGDPLAWCYRVPVTRQEEANLVASEAADAAAAAAVGKGFFNITKRYLSNVFRLAWLFVLFGPVVLWAPLALNKGIRRRQWMRLLRRTLEQAGPAFIKWGQWAATRADLFPRDLCSELEHLHMQAPAHKFPFTERAIQEAFGFELKDLFSEFEEEPVASGSIGQIHRGLLSGAGARLTNMAEGSMVAVKVRHPGVSEAIERDFSLMMAVARVAGSLPALKTLRLDESLEQFAAPLREQVDLAREGYYLHAFNYNFRGERRVSFPVPLYPLVSPAVLVETFEKGDHISSYVARGAGAPYNSELAKIGARTILLMLVKDNLVHSDLHPGNILVKLEPPGGEWGAAALRTVSSVLDKVSNTLRVDLRPDFTSLLHPSIVLLDAGMATRLSPEDQINMVGLFDAFSNLNGPAMADWVLRFAGEEQRCPDPEGFRQDLRFQFDELRKADTFARNDTSNGAEALASVLELVRQHQVTLPGHICATVVTTLVLEGWSHQLDPAHSTLSEVKRVIAMKKGETKLRKAAMWVQSAAVDREILEHVPPFALAGPPTAPGQ